MRSALIACFVLVGAVSVSAQVFPRRGGGGAGAAPANEVPDCVTVRAESRQDGVGFMHVVVVQNRCTTPVRCRIATDADPSPVHDVRLAPGRTEEIVTRTGSPVPGVEPRASCAQEGVAPARPREE